MSVSRIGLVLAAIYVVFAVWVLIQERGPPSTGGWISLPGMATFLVTFPVSAPFELLGAKLDFRRNVDMGIAIGGCALLIYFVGAGVSWLFRPRG